MDVGDEETCACVGFGMIVEQRSWNSEFALVSWSALARSALVILYFLAAAFSILSATPSLRRASMRETSETHAGSTLGSGAAAVSEVPSAPVVKKLGVPSAAHPASNSPARTSICEEARVVKDMGSTPESCADCVQRVAFTFFCL